MVAIKDDTKHLVSQYGGHHPKLPLQSMDLKPMMSNRLFQLGQLTYYFSNQNGKG